MIPRRLSEVRLPYLTGAGIRRICEAGARAAAEDGLIDEEDLPLLDPHPGDADTLGRQANAAGTREWDLPGEVRAYGVGEVLDARVESLGLNQGTFVLVISTGAGDLGRLALAGHRERILSRVRGGDFGAGEDLPAAPNFADGRAALLLYALRRALEEFAGELSVRAAWRIGGIEVRGGSPVHRRDLASAGEVLVSGGSVVAGTGKMSGSVPPFGAPEDGGRHPWEEAGLLERWADLDPPEGRA
jgi:hypothetical protein